VLLVLGWRIGNTFWSLGLLSFAYNVEVTEHAQAGSVGFMSLLEKNRPSKKSTDGCAVGMIEASLAVHKTENLCREDSQVLLDGKQRSW
jgi:hypothetical protein